MIHNLFVIDAGVCLYSYDFKSIDIDQYLLSGFLSAISSFAQETFQAGLQTIKILDGQKLIFYLERSQKLTFCAIANEMDNDHLLEKILADIAQKFIAKFNEKLNHEFERTAIDDYRKFDSTIKQSVKYKAKSRNLRSIILGFTEGLIAVIILTLLTSPLNALLVEEYTGEVFMLYFLALLSASFSLTSFIAGFQAGSPKYGIISGVILFFLISLLLSILNFTVFLNYLYITPFGIVICTAAGYFGGLLQDRMKLYPLSEEKD